MNEASLAQIVVVRKRRDPAHGAAAMRAGSEKRAASSRCLLPLTYSEKPLNLELQTAFAAKPAPKTTPLIRHNLFPRTTKSIWSAYVGRAPENVALTGAIPLLLAADTLSCWISPLARFASPQTTWPPRVPPGSPY